MTAAVHSPRVLLISGLFFPDVGGPATHVRKIAEHFSSLGWKVTVLAFGDRVAKDERYRMVRVSRTLPRILSWFLFTKLIFLFSLRSDCVYAFDLTSSGLPAACAARLFGKPFLLRIGGDRLWERAAEGGKRLMSMQTYYEHGLYATDNPFLFNIMRFVIRSARASVVPNAILKESYVQYYGADESRIEIIKNPFGALRESATREEGTFTFLFAGRFVLYKNLSRVIRAFARVYARHAEARLVFVGEGSEGLSLKKEAEVLCVPLTIIPKVEQNKLFELIRLSSVSLAPALTEFNPNFIMESLALGKPALISRGNGLSVELPDYLQFHPENESEVEAVMERMLDKETYEKALAFVLSLKVEWRWEDVVKEHEKLIAKIRNI